EPLPHAIVDVAAHFQRDTTQNQAPQDEKERQVIAGQGGCQKFGEYGEYDAAETDQPHFVPGPERTNGSDDLAALGRRSRHQPVEHSSAEVAAIQHHIDDEHEASDCKPGGNHKDGSCPCSAAKAPSGPWLISRATRARNSTPRTK